MTEIAKRPANETNVAPPLGKAKAKSKSPASPEVVNESNRRLERRFYRFGKTISWRPGHSNRKRRKGWLNDVSKAGVSFLVESTHPPKVGSTIEFKQFDQDDKTIYEVVRTQRIEGKLTLVACHMQSARNHAGETQTTDRQALTRKAA